MPVTPTYPGVYIEEIPSGVRTLTGVATSITAFLGRTLRGPVNQPITLTNFGDFERLFGGLWLESTVSFAIRDFYRNGGRQAVLVRLFNPDGNAVAKLEFKDPTDVVVMTLEAASQGSWGNRLEATLDTAVSQDIADRFGVALVDLFNLTVVDSASGESEIHRNVTVVESPRRLDLVLAQESQLVRVAGALPSSVPQAATVTIAPTNEGNDGKTLDATTYLGNEAKKEGLHALDDTELINLLAIPPYSFEDGDDIETSVWGEAATYAARRRAMLIVDSPATWKNKSDALSGLSTLAGAIGSNKKNAALFFPRLRQPNPLREGRQQDFAASGAIAGVFSRIDSERGVWKAPAGLETNLNGVTQLTVPLTDAENGDLNPKGINSLRIRPAAGPVIWGSRTLDGNDQLASEWKYIPIRRLALFLEESLYRGTQWAVFEPNDEPLWAQLRLNIGAFLQNLFRQGAFKGRTRGEAYFVKVDSETTTQNDVDRGIVNIVVGFAPLKPAEFVILKIQQIAGQIEA